MKQRHTVNFSVNKPDEFRAFIQQKNKNGVHVYVDEMKKCGASLESLEEVSPGVYDLVLVVDPNHKKYGDLHNISTSRGFRWEILTAPKVEPYEMKELAAEALEY